MTPIFLLCYAFQVKEINILVRAHLAEKPFIYKEMVSLLECKVRKKSQKHLDGDKVEQYL